MLLKKGSKGKDVRKLQEKLGLEITGTFGPKTEAAVKKWQKENGREHHTRYTYTQDTHAHTRAKWQRGN